MGQGIAFLKTYRDVIEHLVDWGGGRMNEAEARRPRRAISAAMRKMFFEYPWRYFKDDRRIVLDAPYETGTVAFDVTGGTTERRLTLTDGTWPDWAAYGRILIGTDTVVYKVAERVSSSVLTLDSGAYPQEDIDAGTTYTLFRSDYPLSNIHRLWSINDESGYWQSAYVPPEEWLTRERNWRTAGKPFYWTIMGGRDFYGSMGIRMSGYPNAVETLDFIATVLPRRLVIDGVGTAWNTGYVTAASGTSITVNSNGLNSEVIGSIIRLSRNSTIPTDVEGGNPYIDQRVITGVSVVTGAPMGGGEGTVDITTVTVDDTIDTDGVTFGTGYCVSDPIDLPEHLYDLFLAWAEYEYAKMAVKEREKDAAAALHGPLGARNSARAWDKQQQEPAFPYPWSHRGWALQSGSVTTTDAGVHTWS